MSDVVRKLQAGIRALEAIKARPDDFESEVSREAIEQALQKIEQTLQTYKKFEEEAKKSAEASKAEVIGERGSTTDTNEADLEEAEKVSTWPLIPAIRKGQKEWTDWGMEEWTVINEKYVGYTPGKFLTEAFTVYKAEPCHVNEFAEKISFAAVWSLKKLFLSHGILLSSQKSCKFFVDWLAEQSNDWKERAPILQGWRAANRLDLYANSCWTGGDFGSYGEDIKTFVSLLSEMKVEKEASN